MSSGEGTLNRSQAIRARRLQRRVLKPSQRKSAGRNGRSVPSMVARNPQVERQLNAGRKRVRRRYHVQLGAEGAELRLPALPVIRFGWRAASATLLGTLLIGLYFLLTAATFTVGRVELRGAQRLNAQDLNLAMGVSGSSILAIKPAEIMDAVREAFPEIETLSMRIGFPARVVLVVQERNPAIAWEQSGITVWVDEAGIAFLPQGEAQNLVSVQALQPPPVLEGKGYARHQLISPEMVAAILALSAHAPEGAPLLYDPKLGFGWSDPAGWDAYFGSEEDAMPQRIAVYKALVADLSGRGLVPTLISVAQLHAPYYRVDY